MKHNTSRTRLHAAAIATAVLLSGFGLSACRQDRWCEFDDTDETVDNSYCEQGTPGYEWEPDGDDHKKSKRSKSKTPTTSRRR